MHPSRIRQTDTSPCSKNCSSATANAMFATWQRWTKITFGFMLRLLTKEMFRSHPWWTPWLCSPCMCLRIHHPSNMQHTVQTYFRQWTSNEILFACPGLFCGLPPWSNFFCKLIRNWTTTHHFWKQQCMEGQANPRNCTSQFELKAAKDKLSRGSCRQDCQETSPPASEPRRNRRDNHQGESLLLTEFLSTWKKKVPSVKLEIWWHLKEAVTKRVKPQNPPKTALHAQNSDTPQPTPHWSSTAALWPADKLTLKFIIYLLQLRQNSNLFCWMNNKRHFYLAPTSNFHRIKGLTKKQKQLSV